MYVRINVCIDANIYIYREVTGNITHTYMCMYVSIYVIECVCTNLYVCMDACMYVYMHTGIYVYVYICVYVYT